MLFCSKNKASATDSLAFSLNKDKEKSLKEVAFFLWKNSDKVK